MKKVVVYQSGTGFTAKYAGWIAERLGCEAKEYKSVNARCFPVRNFHFRRSFQRYFPL